MSRMMTLTTQRPKVRPRFKALALGLAVSAFLAPQALAQAIVLGGGMGKECYMSAKFGTSERAGINTCTLALDTPLTPRDRTSTLVNRGILYMRNGQYELAVSDYERALKLSPDSAEAYLNLGAALIYQESYGDALDALNTSIGLDPKDLYAAYYNRAIAREKTGDVTAAYYDFKKALELNPEFDVAARQLQRFEVRPITQQ